LRVIQNNGMNLREVPSGTISLFYSFDSMVHFEKRFAEAHMPEFERVMAPGAYGFIQHSNFGRISQNPDSRAHPAWRANVDKDFFTQFCFRHKLLAVEQTLLPWSSGEVTMPILRLVLIPSAWGFPPTAGRSSMLEKMA
jgi:hypothetical protein